MAAQHHYVSRFHLRQFCDPDSLSLRDPWVWLGDTASGSIRRRAPKNVGTAPELFDGPGAFSDSTRKLEHFLANEVEAPAALALRELVGHPDGAAIEVPQPLMKYLAWAGSRSIAMQQVATDWATRFRDVLNIPMAEPPPAGLPSGGRLRPVRLIHPQSGKTLGDVRSEDVASLLDDGWALDLSDRANFLELCHIQAHYFQVRWFPRLRWFLLRPPDSGWFILGDRAVGWGVPTCLDAPPCCLRDPEAFLVAPLTRSLALVGRNNSQEWQVTPTTVNAMTAAWAREWVVGPTRDVVALALSDRRRFT